MMHEESTLPIEPPTAMMVNEPDAEHADESSMDNSGGDEATTDKEQQKLAFYIKIGVGLMFVALIVFLIVDSTNKMYIVHAMQDFLHWVEDNPVEGIFAFIIVYFVATILFIPGSILTLGAGFTFAMAFGLGGGVVLGLLAVFLGAASGAIVAFIIGRYLLREQMLKLTKKYVIFEALESALEKNGLRIFTLLRLSPIVPFNVINYVAGVTSVTFRDYVISLFAILPGTILYVFLGASAGSLTESAASGDNSTVSITVAVVGSLFGILSIVMTTRYAKSELNRVTEERRQANDDKDEESGEDRLGESATEQDFSARHPPDIKA